MSFASLRIMRSRGAVIGLLAVSACGTSGDSVPVNTHEAAAEPAGIPLDHTIGFRDGYLVRVTRDGKITWNGQPIETATLQGFIKQFAQMPKDAGRLWIEFEPGVSPARAASLRQLIAATDLCRQHRCVEGGWNVKRPVVN